MKRKWLKKAAVTLILAAALISTSGCGADKAAEAAAGMDIDYYSDGELLDRDEAKAQLKAAQKQAEEAKKAKKKQKEEQQMRDSIEVGDEITTIGGIVGRVVTVKDDSLIIETGAERNRIKIMRWAISTNNTANEKLEAERAAAKEAQEAEKAAKMEEAKAKSKASRKKSKKNKDADAE